MEDKFDELSKRLDDLKDALESGFKKMDGQFKNLNSSLDKLSNTYDDGIDRINAKLDEGLVEVKKIISNLNKYGRKDKEINN